MLLKMYSPYRKLFQATLGMSLRNLSTTKALMKSHYEVLGVSRDATQAEIKNAYFNLTKMYHPDKIPATDENLRKFREISEAYEIIGNEQSRKLYDGGLLGTVKRVGTESTDPVDPIIAFYKQRQDMSKVLDSQQDESGKWSQAHFAQVKQKKYNDLFSMKTTGGLKQDPILSQLFPALYFFVICFLFSLNFEGTAYSRLVKSILEYLNIK